jgi:quercetin dioxygenase-like cupin family protein
MRVQLALCCLLSGLCLAPLLSAQDATKVDPKHYTVISENDQVRILKVHYGPHEKSVMHSHPDAVAVFLTDSTSEFSFPDGKKQTTTSKAGSALFTPHTVHLPENTGDSGMDLILVELKGKPGKAAKMGKE